MVQALIANNIENLKRFRLMLRELGVSLERRHWDEAGPRVEPQRRADHRDDA